MMERFHRKFEVNPDSNVAPVLLAGSLYLLVLHIAVKDNIQSVEIMYRSTLRLPGQFFFLDLTAVLNRLTIKLTKLVYNSAEYKIHVHG